MVDLDTLMTTLYVLADDFTKQQPAAAARPGPKPALSQAEVMTLALLAQWSRFGSERDFYRFAQQHLRQAFPTLPARAQFNRLLRADRDVITAFGLELARLLKRPTDLYEAVDRTAAPTRNIKRRGRGWLAGQADQGWSTRLGWFEGFGVLLSVRPLGVITGFGVAPASTKDQPLAETFLALRSQPQAACLGVGAAAGVPYVMDTGFEGKARHQLWREAYGAEVIAPPRRNSRTPWPKPWRQVLAHLRQIVETVNEKLLVIFRLERERPHELTGFQARLAAKIALHNFCIWLNLRLGRPALAFADLVDW